jgi:hypothetical protein
MSWLPKLFHRRVPDGSGMAQFHPAVYYPVGAENQVYEPAPPVFAAMLPVVFYAANGIPAGHAPIPTQLQQVYANQAAQISGVGGPLAGTIIGAPLNIPETTNGSQ